VIAHNLARWTARIGLGEGIVTTKTIRQRLFSIPGRLTRSARVVTVHLPARWPWASTSPPPWRRCGRSRLRPDATSFLMSPHAWQQHARDPARQPRSALKPPILAVTARRKGALGTRLPSRTELPAKKTTIQPSPT
jgi:hypothetical protein